jgi:hypothetical protein
MSKRDKQLARARNSPKGWTAAALCALLRQAGFEEEAGTKHTHFESPRDRTLFMTVTRSSGEILSHYVKQAVVLIDAHRAIDTH